MREKVVCPNCGYIYTDGDEAMMPGSLTLASSFDEECVECHQPFIIIREIKAVYRTAKKGLPS